MILYLFHWKLESSNLNDLNRVIIINNLKQLGT